MPYALLGSSDHWNRWVEVDKDDFDRVVDAMRSLLRVVGIEEKFDMLAENYDEIEGELDSISRRAVLFSRRAEPYSVSDIQLANRRMVNFLSTARLYLDQVDHDLKTTFGADSGQRLSFDAARRAQYDELFGYRVMEALRNYSQHRDIPIHRITYSSQVKEEGERRQILHTLRISLDVARIEKEGGFHTKVLTELRTRQASAFAEERWLAEIGKAQERFRDSAGGTRVRLYEAVERTDDGTVVASEPVFDSFLDWLTALRLKNAGQGDLRIQLRSAE